MYVTTDAVKHLLMREARTDTLLPNFVLLRIEHDAFNCATNVGIVTKEEDN